MFDENTQNSTCYFAGQSVSYLYGEFRADEKIAFENHLNASCTACAAEIAEFGLLRDSIIGWKKQSFDVLETPPIKIPAAETTKFLKPNFVQLWFRNLKETLAFSPVWAAIVLVAITGGVILFVNNFSNNNLTAKIESVSSSQANVSIPAEKKSDVGSGEISNKTTTAILPNSDSAENKIFTAESLPANRVNSQIVQSKKARNLISKTEIAAQRISVPTSKSKAANDVAAVKTSSAKNRKILKLNDTEEEADENSLLLADLLDEVGGK